MNTNNKSLLSKITSYRSIVRLIVFFLMGACLGEFALGVYLGKTLENVNYLSLAMWMGIALFFENEAHKFRAQNENFQEFLDNPREDEQ